MHPTGYYTKIMYCKGRFIQVSFTVYNDWVEYNWLWAGNWIGRAWKKKKKTKISSPLTGGETRIYFRGMLYVIIVTKIKKYKVYTNISFEIWILKKTFQGKGEIAIPPVALVFITNGKHKKDDFLSTTRTLVTSVFVTSQNIKYAKRKIYNY